MESRRFGPPFSSPHLVGPLRRSESSLARLLPNVSEILSKEDRNQLKRVKAKRQRFRPNQTVSINESPMMIIPKARIRNDFNQLSKRSSQVVSVDDTSGLHLSTIPGPTIVAKSFSRTSLRNHHHSSRSDIDSGIGSMKRSVTFDEISVGRSSLFDDIEDTTDEEDAGKDKMNYEPYPAERYNEMPPYVDTYSDNSYIVPQMPRIKRPKTVPVAFENPDTEENHEANCPICSGFYDQNDRIKKYFGGVDQFFKWFWSKWGKVSHLLSFIYS